MEIKLSIYYKFLLYDRSTDHFNTIIILKFLYNIYSKRNSIMHIFNFLNVTLYVNDIYYSLIGQESIFINYKQPSFSVCMLKIFSSVFTSWKHTQNRFYSDDPENLYERLSTHFDFLIKNIN